MRFPLRHASSASARTLSGSLNCSWCGVCWRAGPFLRRGGHDLCWVLGPLLSGPLLPAVLLPHQGPGQQVPSQRQHHRRRNGLSAPASGWIGLSALLAPACLFPRCSNLRPRHDSRLRFFVVWQTINECLCNAPNWLGLPGASCHSRFICSQWVDRDLCFASVDDLCSCWFPRSMSRPHPKPLCTIPSACNPSTKGPPATAALQELSCLSVVLSSLSVRLLLRRDASEEHADGAQGHQADPLAARAQHHRRRSHPLLQGLPRTRSRAHTSLTPAACVLV